MFDGGTLFIIWKKKNRVKYDSFIEYSQRVFKNFCKLAEFFLWSVNRYFYHFCFFRMFRKLQLFKKNKKQKTTKTDEPIVFFSLYNFHFFGFSVGKKIGENFLKQKDFNIVVCWHVDFLLVNFFLNKNLHSLFGWVDTF